MSENLFLTLKSRGCELVERLLPRLVVAPHSLENLTQLIALAQERRLRLCPMGKGSSFPANHEPAPDTIFVLTLRLNQIVELRRQDAIVRIEAGILMSDFSAHLPAKEFELPAVLATYSGTLGGAILGSDSTGQRHAELRRRLLGLELVDGRGRILKFGGLAVKNVAGLDYWTFMIGSNGRFGILTKIILNLQKLPPLYTLPPESYPADADTTTHWIYANLLKKLDPDGLFAR